MSKSKVFGSHLNDPKPRMAGRIALGGMDFQISPTQGLNPAPQAQPENSYAPGNVIKSVKHAGNK